MKKLFFIFSILIINQLVYAQSKAGSLKESDITQLSQLEKTIADVAKRVVTDSLGTDRLKAHEELIPLMKKMLSIPNVYNYAFTKIEHIAIIESEDKEFKLFTWGVADDNYLNKHHGFVLLNRSRSAFVELKDQSRNIQKPENQSLTADKWYGALYYNTKKFKSKDGDKYLVFGLNFGDTLERTKVCDVLTIKGGSVRFGAPVFELEVPDNKTEPILNAQNRGREKGKEKEKEHEKEKKIKYKTQSRLLLTHSVDASIRLNYDGAADMIIFDHLENIAHNNPSVPFIAVPDGTYEAMELKKGTWRHIVQLKNREMDEAPRPKPILDKRPRSLNREDAKVFQWPEEVTKKKDEVIKN